MEVQNDLGHFLGAAASLQRQHSKIHVSSLVGPGYYPVFQCNVLGNGLIGQSKFSSTGCTNIVMSGRELQKRDVF